MLSFLTISRRAGSRVACGSAPQVRIGEPAVGRRAARTATVPAGFGSSPNGSPRAAFRRRRQQCGHGAQANIVIGIHRNFY